VIFVPGGIPPHKPASSIKASAEDRFHMVEVAIQGNDRFTVDRVEIDTEEPMYSVDTVPLVKERYESDEWFFIAGADEVWSLLSWKEPDKLLEETTMVAAARPGYEFSELEHLAEGLENFDRIIPVECTLVDISASGIRRMLSEGKSIRYLVPNKVHQIIYNKGLYGAQEGQENERSEGHLSERNEA
jgi:nicotinate-nucleotide adenylyltransferase